MKFTCCCPSNRMVDDWTVKKSRISRGRIEVSISTIGTSGLVALLWLNTDN